MIPPAFEVEDGRCLGPRPRVVDQRLGGVAVGGRAAVKVNVGRRVRIGDDHGAMFVEEPFQRAAARTFAKKNKIGAVVCSRAGG